jgi:hypothetical protein
MRPELNGTGSEQAKQDVPKMTNEGLGVYGVAIVASLIMALLARPLLIQNPSADNFMVSTGEPIESPT